MVRTHSCVFFVVASFAACSSDNELSPGPGTFDPAYATSSSYITRMSGPVLGTSPHKEVQIWYSANIDPALDDDSLTAPVGTVAVKTANMDDQPGIDAIVVMVKKEKGYDSANGDWYYDMRTPAGAIMNDDKGNPVSGKVAMCINCHQGFKTTDYLGGTKLRK